MCALTDASLAAPSETRLRDAVLLLHRDFFASSAELLGILSRRVALIGLNDEERLKEVDRGTTLATLSVLAQESSEYDRQRVLLKVVGFLSAWQKAYPGDLEEPGSEPIVAELLHALETASTEVRSATETLRRQLEQKRLQGNVQREMKSSIQSSPPASTKRKKSKSETLRIVLSSTPEDMAFALTLEFATLICKVEGRELCGKAQRKASENVAQLVQLFNSRVLWLCDILLAACREKEGSRCASLFIQVAHHALFSNCDCNCALEMLTALTTPCATLLMTSLAPVSEKDAATLQEVRRLMSSEGNYELLRALQRRHRASGAPHIPALPVLTHDLVSIEDKIALRTGFVNIPMMIRVGEIIDDFLGCQRGHGDMKTEEQAEKTRPQRRRRRLAEAMRVGMLETLSMAQLYREAKQLQTDENDALVRTLEYLGL